MHADCPDKETEPVQGLLMIDPPRIESKSFSLAKEENKLVYNGTATSTSNQRTRRHQGLGFLSNARFIYSIWSTCSVTSPRGVLVLASSSLSAATKTLKRPSCCLWLLQDIDYPIEVRFMIMMLLIIFYTSSNDRFADLSLDALFSLCKCLIYCALKYPSLNIRKLASTYI